MSSDHLPIVKQIVEKELKESPLDIERMVIGIRNEVYKVTTPSKAVIVRMNSSKKQLVAVERNIKLFSTLGISVPEMLASDYSQESFPMSYQILSYIEGKDLGQVVEAMTDQELRGVAKEVAAIFRKLSTIPTNGKFGWVGGDDDGLVDSWTTVMKSDRIEERNNKTGVVGEDLVKREKELYAKYIPYFNSVKSTLYYDDISSKNILVNDGKFSGLVDLDDITYGDPLEAVGSIKATWYGTRHGDLYTKAVEDELGLTDEQRKMVSVYALLNRILWLSEKGIKFNANTSEQVDETVVKRSKEIIEKLFEEVDL